jgi:hypothetical protein
LDADQGERVSWCSEVWELSRRRVQVRRSTRRAQNPKPLQTLSLQTRSHDPPISRLRTVGTVRCHSGLACSLSLLYSFLRRPTSRSANCILACQTRCSYSPAPESASVAVCTDRSSNSTLESLTSRPSWPTRLACQWPTFLTLEGPSACLGSETAHPPISSLSDSFCAAILRLLCQFGTSHPLCL